MKKILLIVLILVCMINTGCTKQDDFKHYNLIDKDLNIYIYIIIMVMMKYMP